MNTSKLYQILNETTVQLRKGEVVHGTPELVSAINEGREELPGGVVTIDAMPHESEAGELKPIDCFFLTVGVDMAKAEARRAEFIDLLDNYPNAEELARGPSYIAVGAAIGDQGAAFQLFALGAALGLWSIITPGAFGLTGEEAQCAAGSGFIMITGYRRGQAASKPAAQPQVGDK